ncbi:hypothetical protein DVH24_010823 [Malus domestica]|uniref:Serine-threonine/tyrosine-protein kinase catalytic domain-containing protein n=1 Tax=Malus domestica TaxID=3750 RepID=A0A498JRU7_MALDO|nr:hypothetical protein DVH24_010823 [Malus domestica]
MIVPTLRILCGRVLITMVTHSYQVQNSVGTQLPALLIKSDIYSFSVTVLEIVNGKRNKGFSHPGHNLNLLGHKDYILTALANDIHCVTVTSLLTFVILMLSGESALPQPQKPGFYSERDLEDLICTILDQSRNY